MNLILTLALLIYSTMASATPLEECISARLSQIQESEAFSRSGKVRCEGAGLFEGGKFRQSEVCFRAAPGWEIDGNAQVKIVSDNRGHAGQVNYGRDENGKISRACVQISCRSPSKPFGPGAWMAIELTGSVTKVIEEGDREKAAAFCLKLLSNR